MKSISTAILLILPVLACAKAVAQPSQPSPTSPATEFELAWILFDADIGRERLAAEPEPEAESKSEVGGEALHTVRFHHQGGGIADGLRIVAPVPAGRQFVPGSATGPAARIAFSVDGGETFAPADELMVPGDESGGPPRDAVPGEYTHIRWDLAGRFPPGVSGLVSFRTRPADEAGP